MKKVFFGMTVVSAVLCFLAGCVTSVPVSYTEPARLDLSGVKRVAIDSDNSQVGASVSQKLNATGKYTIASAAELAQWKLWSHQQQSTEVGSADLVQAYRANILRADETYKGEVLKMTSAAQEIDQDSSGNYYVRFEGTGDNAIAIFFRSSESNQIRALNPGQTATVIGECIGRDLPESNAIQQLLQRAGGGRPIIIIDATFQVEAPAVDAIIALKTVADVQNSTRAVQQDVKDANGNTVTDANGNTVREDVPLYERSASVEISYTGMRAQDRSPIGNGNAAGASELASEWDQSKLPAGEQLLATATEKALQDFDSALTPTQRSVSINLAKEADNAEAKKEMGAADKLVKAKDYAGAAAEYGKVYAKYQNFAAGYNQAVLTEVASGTAAAVGLMEAVAQANPGNATAQNALRDMRARNVANQMSAAQSAN